MNQKDNNSLSHTKWNSKHDIVFAPKYRRKVDYIVLRKDVIEIIKSCVRR